MTFRSKMNYSIETILFKGSIYRFFIGDIQFFKNIIGPVLHILQVFKVTCISKCISIYNFIMRIFVYKPSYHMGTDKPGASCYQYGFAEFSHYGLLFFQNFWAFYTILLLAGMQNTHRFSSTLPVC